MSPRKPVVLRVVTFAVGLWALAPAAGVRAQPAEPPPAPPAESGAPPPPPVPPGATGEGPTSPPTEEDAAAPAPGKKKKKKKDDAEGSALPAGLVIKGRVFARAAFEKTSVVGRNSQSLDLSIASARIGIKYDPTSYLGMVVEADVGNKPLLRDAFVQAKGKHLRGRLGQFKIPVSSINLESPWNLPVARRGFINDVMGDRMRAIGRRPGAIASYRGGGKLDPELSLAVMQGSQYDNNGGGDLITGTALDTHNIAARLSITPGGNEVALVGQRITTRDPMSQLAHFWMAGADLTGEWGFASGALRLWSEVLFGDTRYTRTMGNGQFDYFDARYWEGRTIAAWRWGGLAVGEPFFEVFAQGGVLDASLSGSNDLLVEGAAGVNLGLWRQARLTLEVEHAQAGSGVPFDLFFQGQNLEEDTSVILQVGAAF